MGRRFPAGEALATLEIAKTGFDLPENDWRRVARAQGVEWVIVNGVAIFRRGEDTGAAPGRMLGVGGSQVDRAIGNLPAMAAE